MRVRFVGNVYDGGKEYKAGEIYDIPEEDVKRFGDLVEVLKEIDTPPVDKMVHKPERKK
jgi:tetrahydromethanopterin S-methyltransferase subunit A